MFEQMTVQVLKDLHLQIQAQGQMHGHLARLPLLLQQIEVLLLHIHKVDLQLQ